MTNQNLWAPWRMDYLQALDPASKPAGSAGGCFLCDATSVDLDAAACRERLVLLSDERGAILLNRYPYTNGHLLIAPRAHVGDLVDLDDAQRRDLMDLTDLATRLIRAAINPQGLNIGMNIGRAAGAGVPGHLHMHVVPRWHGDVNFMQVAGGVRVIPQAIEQSYQCLAEALQQLTT